MRKILLALGLLATPASAQTLHYTGYAAFLPVLVGELTWEPTAAGYRIVLVMRSTGIAAVISPARAVSDATGVWATDGDLQPARPRHYASHSVHGAAIVTSRIDYDTDGLLSGSVDRSAGELVHEPVDAALMAHAVDGLSVIAGLLHDDNGAPGCGGTVHYSDLEELNEVTWHLAGPEQLAPSSYSTFAGTALRCDFVVRHLAGFRISEDYAKASEPMPGSVWLAQVGGTLVPVRIALGPQSLSGAFTAYLDGPEAAPGSPEVRPPP